MDNGISSEIASAAAALTGLDVQLRRHHYHSPEEDSDQLDLIELGAITNLEWDEKDGLWAQLDELVTFDITPTGSSICVYLDEEPVVTLWAGPGPGGPRWDADWEADLTGSEQGRFLRKIRSLVEQSTGRVKEAVVRLREDGSDASERAELTEAVRAWLGAVGS